MLSWCLLMLASSELSVTWNYDYGVINCGTCAINGSLDFNESFENMRLGFEKAHNLFQFHGVWIRSQKFSKGFISVGIVCIHILMFFVPLTWAES